MSEALLSTRLRKLAANAAFFWCLFFLALNYLNPSSGGTNAPSRLATLQAMSREGTFSIDHYYNGRTVDWSLAPNGHYYSNKAPGPMFIAFPLGFVMDRVHDWIYGHVLDYFPEQDYRVFLCLLTQMIPFALLVLWASSWLERQGVSWMARQYFALAALFGNTAALFMDSFFGHGMAAWLVLATFAALVERRWTLAGLAMGFTALSDYGALTFLPAFALAVLAGSEREERLPSTLTAGSLRRAAVAFARLLRWKYSPGVQPASHFRLAGGQNRLASHPQASRSQGTRIRQVALGAILPAALWIWYHATCFGSPFALPQKYINPQFVDPPSTEPRLWGLLSIKPHWDTVYELLFGSTRGILVTQPWFLLAYAGGIGLCFNRGSREKSRIRRSKVPKSLLWFALLGFLPLLQMNASFNGWHGGDSPGPRYLCLIFPLFAILAGFVYDRSYPAMRALLWIALGSALLLRLLIYIDWILIPPGHPLWPYFVGVALEFRFRPWFKIVLCSATAIAMLRLSRKYQLHASGGKRKRTLAAR